MAREREYVDHVFGRRMWKIYYKEEEDEKKIKKGEKINKRIVKYYMEGYSPKVPQIIIDMVEKYVDKRVVKIKLKYMDSWGRYTST